MSAEISDNYGKKRKLKMTSGNLIREFSDVTTLHGVHYVGDKDITAWERWCWAIVIILCATFCGLEISNLWSKWQSKPIIISFENKPSYVKNIPLPALTICPENKVKKSFVDLERNLTQMMQQLNGKLEYQSDEQKLQVEAISIVCQEKSKISERDPMLMLANSYGVVPTKEHMNLIMDKISPNLSDIFESCYLGEEEHDCSNLFRPILLPQRLCYTFNTMDDQDLYTSAFDQYSVDAKRLNLCNNKWDPELGFAQDSACNYPRHSNGFMVAVSGLKFALKSKPEEVQQLCSMEDADTFRVTVQSPYQFPEVYYDKFFHVNPGSETTITLKPNIVTTAAELRRQSYTPKIRECNFPDDKKLELFKMYTLNNCLDDCVLNSVRRICKCQNYFQPVKKIENLPYCRLNEFKGNDSCYNAMTEEYDRLLKNAVNSDLQGLAAGCNCLPGCSEMHYHYQVTHKVFRNINGDNNERSNLTIINMYFESDTFLAQHRSELYGITDFIASCGGLLGLFTGFSLISLIEIFYFATLRLACKLKRKRDVIGDSSDIKKY